MILLLSKFVVPQMPLDLCQHILLHRSLEALELSLWNDVGLIIFEKVNLLQLGEEEDVLGGIISKVLLALLRFKLKSLIFGPAFRDRGRVEVDLENEFEIVDAIFMFESFLEMSLADVLFDNLAQILLQEPYSNRGVLQKVCNQVEELFVDQVRRLLLVDLLI